MMSCRVSRDLALTRTWSPWIEACAFVFMSLIVFTISRAFSVEIPWLIVIACREVPPPACSMVPLCYAFRDYFRLTNFSSSTLRQSFTFCSVLDLRVIVGFPPSSDSSTLEPVSLKSKR